MVRVSFRRWVNGDSWGTKASGSPRNPSCSREPHGGNPSSVIRFSVFHLHLKALAFIAMFIAR